MFNKTVEHYKKKFKDEYAMIDTGDIENIASSHGIHNLKVELEANSAEFKDFAYDVASFMPGRVSCVAYACAVASIADKYGVPYKKFVGFCLPKSSSKYDENIDAFKKGKEQGKEHPIFATHVYITIGDNTYEYFNGEYENIDHIDVVEF